MNIDNQDRCNYTVVIDGTYFQWDLSKNEANSIKHGISFEEAATAFTDNFALYLRDTIHSTEEERFILLGKSVNQNLLVVCHCYREPYEIIRIISARKATKNEEGLYEERLFEK